MVGVGVTNTRSRTARTQYTPVPVGRHTAARRMLITSKLSLFRSLSPISLISLMPVLSVIRVPSKGPPKGLTRSARSNEDIRRVICDTCAVQDLYDTANGKHTSFPGGIYLHTYKYDAHDAALAPHLNTANIAGTAEEPSINSSNYYRTQYGVYPYRGIPAFWAHSGL